MRQLALSLAVLLLPLSFLDTAHSQEIVGPPKVHEQLLGTLWVQTSVEHDMVCAQAYALAQVRLKQALKKSSWTAALEQRVDYEKLPPAVILDVYETVLDNSPFQARLVESNSSFDPQSWKAWVDEEQAALVPGAKDFIRFARSKGVDVFFVTNRTADEEPATVRNLTKELGLDITADQVLSKQERPHWDSNKTPRRSLIAKRHRVLLIIGDDLNDYAHVGDLPPAQRKRRADEYRHYWGKKWINLPNPIYGNWERAVLEHASDLPTAERVERKYNALRTRD